MSKRQSKAQASSSRATSSAAKPGFGGGFGGFGSSAGTFGGSASPLSYLAEQPDLATVTDSNVVVNFKNLSKKDSTTKAKALEDIHAYVSSCIQSQQDLEEGIIDAWKSVYPRTSIDNSRRVRQDAHALHGQICVASGKRIARHMPSLVGPWIAGVHDSDKAVARAASESLQAVFSTPEKQANLHRIYQTNILIFARDAALEETAQTLSDERTTTGEDADAKYYRVVSSNLAVVAALLTNLPDAETQKEESVYAEFVTSKRIQEFLSAKDSSVRRSVFRLFNVYLAKRSDLMSTNVSHLGSALLSKNVVRHQSGSASEFVELLVALSTSFPALWSSPDGKLQPATKLADLVKAGSQGGPPQYWNAVSKLFQMIPQESLPSEPADIHNLVAALHSGITRRDEPRTYAESAWNCYLSVLGKLASQLDFEKQQVLVRERAFPAVKQYLTPTSDNVVWNIPGPRAPGIIARLLALTPLVSVAEEEWPVLKDGLLERVQTSAPEQSKDYQVSQSSVAAEGIRFFSLESHLLRSNTPESFAHAIMESTAKIMIASENVLKARHGKPYGAAGVVEAAVRFHHDWIFQHEDLSEQLIDFLIEDMPGLLPSASRPYLIALLYGCKQHPQFNEAWNAVLNAAQSTPDDATRATLLSELLGSPHIPQDFQAPSENAALQIFLVGELQRSVVNGTSSNLLNSILASPARILSADSADSVLADMTDNLTLNGNASNALAGLETVAKRNPEILSDFLASAKSGNLVQNLLLLTESADEDLANTALALNRTVEGVTSTSGRDGAATSSTPELVHRSLFDAGPMSLSIETVVELGKRFLSKGPSTHLIQILPDATKWTEALQPFLEESLPPALALTDSLGGAIYLVISRQTTEMSKIVDYDRDGFSVPLRLALYTVKLLTSEEIMITLDDDQYAQLYRLLALTTQLLNDNTAVHGSSSLWRGQDPTIEADLLDFISETQKLLTAWLTQSPSEPKLVQIAHDNIFQASSALTASSFHNARVYAHSVSERIETYGWQQGPSTDLEARLKSLRRSKDIFSFAAFLVAYKVPLSTTPTLTRICNELVAGLTGIRLSSANASDALQQLVYLNLIIQDQDQIVETIAKQRLIFFIQHVVPWLGDDAASLEVRAELSKALVILLPHVKDIYGGFWQTLLESLAGNWRKAGQIRLAGVTTATVPLLHSSLKLAITLQRLFKDEDSNDDLKDAWKDQKTELASALLLLLQELGVFADNFNLPLQITNEVLGRVIASMSVEQVGKIEDLYPLMGAASQSVQRTAFSILHKQIPFRQEQVSVDVALDKTAARLPEELLSLIIDAPTLDSLADTSFERVMPPSLQGYLSSWLLVFDHFQGASDKVKADYTVHLKEGDYLNGLLSLIFDFLGHSRGKPIDASKFDITSYQLGIEESPVRDVQWLLIHLYYLCLKRTPALTKTWWTECKSRQTVINMESWTEKYISPEIISNALTAVSEWADSQDANSDEALVVKANQRTKEVTVSKEIDDQMMSLVIRLPNNFPLGQAVLHGVNRVAVDEKKWRSWLLNSQGVITFSNNSLIDGIIAFRRNVVGALKGQTECAICYSIVGADKQLPTKRCATCKNLFHGSCLYRWFKTSNSSSCPLCRNPFNYT